MLQKKVSALPVRLTEEEKVQMARIAEETGLTVSTLVRLLISSLVSYYRENDNRLTLPLRWKELTAAIPAEKGKKQAAPKSGTSRRKANPVGELQVHEPLR
ncbi:MAG: hypothetical protein ACI4Q3_07195 [Kiritimatiellia bacterium]